MRLFDFHPKLKIFIAILFLGVLSASYSQQEIPDSLNTGLIQEDTTLIEFSPIDSSILRQIRISPKSFIFYAQQGQSYFQRGELDSSEFYYKIAVGLCDTVPDIYFMLGKIELQRGESRIIPLEKLRALLKRDHKSRAIKFFKQALKLNPDFLDARYHLGCTYLAKAGKKNLEKAETEFQTLINQLPDYKDTLYQLARVYQEMQDFDRAIDIYRRLSISRRDEARALIRLSEIFLELGINDAACRTYFRGIAKLTDEDMLQAMYLDIELLLTNEEREFYQALSLQKKGFFFKKFWKSRDPTPGTVINERLIEHFQRVKFARENFRYTAPPFYDDRGKIYIKYGPPTDRFVSALTRVQAKENESWSYVKINDKLVFDFVADGGVFRLVQDLRQAALPGMGYNGEIYLAQQLYSERAHVNNVYAILSTSLDEAKLNSFQMNQIEVMGKIPPEVYQYDYKAKPLPIVYNSAQFKGQNDSTEIDFYFSLPASLLSYSEKKNEITASYLEYTFFINDSLYNDILTQKQAVNLVKAPLPEGENGNFILEQNFVLYEGDYHLSLQLESHESNRMGLFRIDLPVRRFDNDRLAVSDLKLADNISPGTTNSGRNWRQSLKMTPHPFKSVLRDKPIYLYYEVYNLKLDANGQTTYRIEYRAKTLKETTSFFGKTFQSFASLFGSKQTKELTSIYERTSNERNINEYLAFDFSNLPLGETRIEVVITDLQSNETASAETLLNLIKE
ncbi:GWxTD domain-containing protein [candidate division KSB1 bacterium]|nr:GWxTD domain-containing protein [candidate division KSB1 bacterium]